MGFLFQRYRWLGLTALISIGIHLFSKDPARVEAYYGNTLYPAISQFRTLWLGWLPFSLGDVFYLATLIWLMGKLVRTIRRMRAGISFIHVVSISSVLVMAMSAYIVFNILWGLNYNRPGLEHRFYLKPRASDTSLLPFLTEALLQQVNRYALGYESSVSGHIILRDRALHGYADLKRRYPSIPEAGKSLKVSIFGGIGNYLGYSGYFNPFTGEGQLNQSIPGFLHPFVVCHELAHQLGFARENEANVAGFMAARSSRDSAMMYSAYLEMFLYANRALYAYDSLAYQKNMDALPAIAKNHVQELKDFQVRFRSPVEKSISRLYHYYLRANGQKEGIQAYSRSIIWLLAMYRQDRGI